MLAQGQEVFLEKQISDGKKVGLLAKLASQAGFLYAQAVEGTQENVNKAIFEKVWLLVVQVSSISLVLQRQRNHEGILKRFEMLTAVIDQVQLHGISSTVLPSIGR